MPILLPEAANLLPEAAEWEPALYQIETDDPVIGGVNGISNLHARLLGNRTQWLKAGLESTTSALALDLSQLKGKVRHTIEVGGGKVWADADNTLLTAAINAMIAAAVTALVASSPATLDTLKELATALGNDPNFATTMTNALAAKAPLASPVFTGAPSGPTAATGTNTGQLATTAFVNNAVAALVASSPAALDTLKELATALGNDPNFATTMTNALAAKAPLASPVFTGAPWGPTAATGTDTGQLATTAFVNNTVDDIAFPADIQFWAGYGANGISKDLAVQVYGVARVGRALTITGLSASLSLAATGAALIFDIKVNGTSIWTTKPYFSAGSTVLTAGVLNPAMITIPANSHVLLEVTQVGSVIRGKALHIALLTEVA